VACEATQRDCTVCIIKPHAVSAGHTGAIIDSILGAGFRITAMQNFTLDKTAASELLDVYQSVLPDFSGMADQLSSGICVALELQKASCDNVVDAFRQLAGPLDPIIAQHIRPNTLRARFGSTRLLNAVHCTDLSEDGPLESEFFFSILQQRR